MKPFLVAGVNSLEAAIAAKHTSSNRGFQGNRKRLPRMNGGLR